MSAPHVTSWLKDVVTQAKEDMQSIPESGRPSWMRDKSKSIEVKKCSRCERQGRKAFSMKNGDIVCSNETACRKRYTSVNWGGRAGYLAMRYSGLS